MSDDLTKARATVLAALARDGVATPPRWRTVITDSESPTGVAPVCAGERSDALHMIDDYPGGPQRDEDGVYDCCPYPQFDTYSADMAAYLVGLLNADAAAPAEALTVYRAEWYGDPLCTYTDLKAAQKHCEAAARVNLFNRDDVPVSWVPDDEGDPAIWDLVERRCDVKEPTGYCVVGANVASEYDEGAGE